MTDYKKSTLDITAPSRRHDPAVPPIRSTEAGDEDISAAIDGLMSPTGSYRSITPQERLAHDRQADAELKEMFNNIVLQFLEPVGISLKALSDFVAAGAPVGEKVAFHRNVDACLGSLKALINATETLKYHDIYDVLKAIERPLFDVQSGKRNILSEREMRNLLRDFSELSRLIYQSLGRTQPPTAPPESRSARERYKTASNYLLSEMLSYYKMVDPVDIQRLHAAGITRLMHLTQASAEEIAQAANLSVAAAEQIKLCTLRALMNVAPDPVTPDRPSLRPSVADEAVVLSEYADDPLGDESPLPTTMPPFTLQTGEAQPSERDRLTDTLGIMRQEVQRYGQAAENLNAEFGRIHRALLRLRVERERLHGEIEFNRDELKQFLEQAYLNDTADGREALSAHKTLTDGLRQVTESILTAMKKMDHIYTQMEDAVRDVRDLEIDLTDLRRKRRGPRAGRGRTAPPETE